ncbi:hypothetical protein ACFOWX_03185 [Sphingorhabdus arenilitoris]|uniref:Uncharacterized protein n=1 Tax=Sphingorhabdus arenilitoris TaxID=1490041 RepID=A0ABV8RDV9_9SPHN
MNSMTTKALSAGFLALAAAQSNAAQQVTDYPCDNITAHTQYVTRR